MNLPLGYRSIAGIFVGFVLVACSPLTLLSSVSPSQHFERVPDLPYGTADRQRLDFYRPRDVTDDAPLVVFFYGGGWKNGTKEEYEFVASSLTRAGFVVAIPDYRVFPDIRFPTFVEDGAAAVVWAEQNAARFGADGRKLYLMGHSAGAHIAALLALDKRYLAKAGSSAENIAGLIGLSGPYDFLPIGAGSYLLDVFPEETRDDSQPINFVAASSPPALLIHGGDDRVVQEGNSERLAERLRSFGVPVTLQRYAGVGHGRIVVALAPPLDFIAATLDDCVAFIRQREATDP